MLGDSFFADLMTAVTKAAARDGIRDDGIAIRRYAMPRSAVQVQWPEPPWWLDEQGRSSWDEFRKRRHFDPARHGGAYREDGGERLARWWLDLLSRRPAGRRPPGARWRVTPWWKRHFRVALFSAASDFVPAWLASGKLGDAKLGALGLGEEDSPLSGPGDGDWPQTIA